MGVTLRGTPLASTANTASYTYASFTPVAGERLAVPYFSSAQTDLAPTMTASANGLTFSLVDSHLANAGAHTIGEFLSDQVVPASPSAMTITITFATASTGCDLDCLGVTGITRSGLGAVRQIAGADNNLAASGTPTVTFGSACLTTSVVIAHVGDNTNPAGITPPTGWTEYNDSGWATPTTGHETCGIASGFTSTTVTFGAVTPSRGGVLAFELDTTSSGLSAGASVPLTDTVTSSAIVGVSSGAAIPLTDTVSSSAVVGAFAGAALALTCAITATAVVGTSSGTSVNETAAITSSAVVGTSSGSTIPLTDTIASAAVVGKATGSSVPLTDTIASAAVVGVQSGAAIGLTFAISATAHVTAANDGKPVDHPTLTLTTATPILELTLPASTLTLDAPVSTLALTANTGELTLTTAQPTLTMEDA